MKNCYYETLDENFTQALKLYEEDYSHKELLDMLKNGNIVQKQISAIRLEDITSKDDADILVGNLTGQDGKIREAVSQRLKEFMSDEKYLQYFKTTQNYKIFLDAIIDINANICRNIICAISNLKDDNEFCDIFCTNLAKLTNELLEIIEKFNFQEGKYKVNKEVFKLYWCLETIYEFYDKIDFNDLKQIIKRAKDVQEYTIREKVAKILTRNFQDADLASIKLELKKDSNYYVRRI